MQDDRDRLLEELEPDSEVYDGEPYNGDGHGGEVTEEGIGERPPDEEIDPDSYVVDSDPLELDQRQRATGLHVGALSNWPRVVSPVARARSGRGYTGYTVRESA